MIIKEIFFNLHILTEKNHFLLKRKIVWILSSSCGSLGLEEIGRALISSNKASHMEMVTPTMLFR